METNTIRRFTFRAVIAATLASAAAFAPNPAAAATSCHTQCSRFSGAGYPACMDRCDQAFGDYAHDVWTTTSDRVRTEIRNRASNLRHRVENFEAGWMSNRD